MPTVVGILTFKSRINFSLSCAEHEKSFLAYVITKTQISCALIAQMISAFAFASQVLTSLFFFSSKFQAIEASSLPV